MKAAYYIKQGKAKDCLIVDDIQEILPDNNEVQIEMYYSGINQGDIKKRADIFGYGMSYPQVIPHSDGSGYIRKVGKNISKKMLGKKVLCFGAQSYRAFGTASEYCCLPMDNIILIDDSVPLDQAAQIGIPGITAYRCIQIAGDLNEKNVLIQGGSGSVGLCSSILAKRANANVISTVRNKDQIYLAKESGADEVFIYDDNLKENIIDKFSQKIDHIVEVDFSTNIDLDIQLLKNCGTISTYASKKSPSEIPFWNMIFSNISVHFLGSDDFPKDIKRQAMKELTKALSDGWKGLPIGKIFNLENIIQAHEYIENNGFGRALLKIK